MNDQWECYLCCREASFDKPASGFLGNYHPLCAGCADSVMDSDHPDNFRVTYHHQLGDVVKGLQLLQKDVLQASDPNTAHSRRFF